jgi:hypothetical protein
MRVDYHTYRFMETVEERIMRLLLEEKAILRILRTLDREYDTNKAMTQWSNSQYQRSIFEDDLIWLN